MKTLLWLALACVSLDAQLDAQQNLSSPVNLLTQQAAGLGGELRFWDGQGTGYYVGFRGPSTALSANLIWTLPSVDGLSGYVLTTNGSGQLSWTAAGGTGSAPPGTDQEIPYNKAGAWAADANLKWDYTGKNFNITGNILTPGTYNIGSTTSFWNNMFAIDFTGQYLQIVNGTSFAVGYVLGEDTSNNLALTNGINEIASWTPTGPGGNLTQYGNILPYLPNSANLGSVSQYWANVYSNAFCLVGNCISAWPGASFTSITGTANQVSVNGSFTAPVSSGAVTLALPQSIGTGSVPTFAGLSLNGGITWGADQAYLIGSLSGNNASDIIAWRFDLVTATATSISWRPDGSGYGFYNSGNTEFWHSGSTTNALCTTGCVPYEFDFSGAVLPMQDATWDLGGTWNVRSVPTQLRWKNLNLSGGIFMNGAIVLNSSYGTSGQVLTSGGSSGPDVWADPVAIPSDMMTTDTAQNVTGVKNLEANLTFGTDVSYSIGTATSRALYIYSEVSTAQKFQVQDSYGSAAAFNLTATVTSGQKDISLNDSANTPFLVLYREYAGASENQAMLDGTLYPCTGGTGAGCSGSGYALGALTTPWYALFLGSVLPSSSFTPGEISLANSYGSISLNLPTATFTAYNWNWPMGPGTSGQCLQSGGGGSSAMVWGSCGSSGGGIPWPSGSTAGAAVYSGSNSWSTTIPIGTAANDILQLNSSGNVSIPGGIFSGNGSYGINSLGGAYFTYLSIPGGGNYGTAGQILVSGGTGLQDSWASPSSLVPSDMMTTDTGQNVTGVKNWQANQTFGADNSYSIGAWTAQAASIYGRTVVSQKFLVEDPTFNTGYNIEAAANATSAYVQFIDSSGNDILTLYRVWTGSTYNNAVLDENFLPSRNNSYTLGNSTAVWSNVYTYALTLGAGGCTGCPGSPADMMTTDTAQTVTGLKTLQANVVFASDNTYSLGAATTRAASIYTQSLTGQKLLVQDSGGTTAAFNITATVGSFQKDIAINDSANDPILILYREYGGATDNQAELDATFYPCNGTATANSCISTADSLGTATTPWYSVYASSLYVGSSSILSSGAATFPGTITGNVLDLTGGNILLTDSYGSINLNVPTSTFTTYNWNWPLSAGTTGQCLVSAGGGSAAMTWGTCGGTGGSMVYPPAGVPNSTGSAWSSTSYAVGTAANDLVQLNSSAQLPAVSGALLTGIYPGAGIANSTGTGWGTSYTLCSGSACGQSSAYGDIPSLSAQGILYATGVTAAGFCINTSCITSWPSGGGGGMVYPGAGLANSTGSAWGTSYTVGNAANNIPQLTSAAALSLTGAVIVALNSSATVPQQHVIEGSTNTNQQLLIGYNTSSNYGSIQAILQGTAAEPLYLNPAGGNVGVDNTSASYALDVTGVVRASLQFCLGAGTPSCISAWPSSSGGVTSIIGGAGSIEANGTTGTAQTGQVTLTTIQPLASNASPTFAGLSLTGSETVTGSVTASVSLLAGVNYINATFGLVIYESNQSTALLWADTNNNIIVIGPNATVTAPNGSSGLSGTYTCTSGQHISSLTISAGFVTNYGCS